MTKGGSRRSQGPLLTRASIVAYCCTYCQRVTTLPRCHMFGIVVSQRTIRVPLRAPEPVLGGHLPDQRRGFHGHPRISSALCLRLPPPQRANSLPVPAKDRVRLHDRQRAPGGRRNSIRPSSGGALLRRRRSRDGGEGVAVMQTSEGRHTDDLTWPLSGGGGAGVWRHRVAASEGRDEVAPGVPRILWTVGSIRAVAEDDANVHEDQRGANPLNVRVHQGQ